MKKKVFWGQIRVDETKLKQIITWPNFTLGQLSMWIGANNDQIWLPMGNMSDSEQCSNRLQLDLISLLVNFSQELGQIMIRYDFLYIIIFIAIWGLGPMCILHCKCVCKWTFNTYIHINKDIYRCTKESNNIWAVQFSSIIYKTCNISDYIMRFTWY